MIFLITLFLWLQDKKITALKICFKKTNRHACEWEEQIKKKR
jgi:hypothetical protein